MKIDGAKVVYYAIMCVWIFAVLVLIAAIYTDSTSGPKLFGILLVVVIALHVTFVALKEALTYYILDENGITEHFLSRTRTFSWDECRFIKRIGRKRYERTIDTIVCSKSGLPANISERKVCSYRWPEKNTMFIVGRSDEIYQQFLTWCGGERDIRE